MKCQICNIDNPNYAKFCCNCGKEISEYGNTVLDEEEYNNYRVNITNSITYVHMENIIALSASINNLPLDAVDSVLEKIDEEKLAVENVISELNTIKPPQKYSNIHIMLISATKSLLEAIIEFKKSVQYNNQSNMNKATFFASVCGSKFQQLNEHISKLE